MSRFCFPMLALLLAPAVSFAQDSSSPAGDLEKMLNAIPDVKQAEAPKEEQKAEEEQSMDLPTYTAEVRKAVLAQWKPDPKWFKKDPKLAAQFLVKVGEDGTITDVKPVRLSGYKKFDESAFDVIWATGKVLAPTYSLLGTVGEQGVLVNFMAPK